MIHNKHDGILSHKFYLNQMFFMFGINIKKFVYLFKIQRILENANQIQEGIIKSKDQLKDLSVTSEIIQKYYDTIFCNIDQVDFKSDLYKQVDLQLINQLYENIASFNQNEIMSFIEKVQILKCKFKFSFFEDCSDIIYKCKQMINLINSKYALSYQNMLELINPLHANVVQKIIQIHQQRFKFFTNLNNFEYTSCQILFFIDIYRFDFDFSGQKLIQLTILLQYFEMLLDNKLQKHMYVDFKNLKDLENVRDPYQITKVFLNYSDNLREEFKIKFVKNNKITQNIRKQVMKVFRSQLVQEIMKDIQQQQNLPIDLSWDFLPYISLVIIPNCNFKGLTLRNRGITINLTPFLNLYKQGFSNGYKDIMYAYCILVAINGWNCLQLLKKTQKSFYWYDDHIQHLNLEEFQLYKQIFGITHLQENRQLFTLQYLNQDTAKLILSIGQQQFTKDELHHQFRLFPGPHLQQNQLTLFMETLEEQEQLNLKLE